MVGPHGPGEVFRPGRSKTRSATCRDPACKDPAVRLGPDELVDVNKIPGTLVDALQLPLSQGPGSRILSVHPGALLREGARNVVVVMIPRWVPFSLAACDGLFRVEMRVGPEDSAELVPTRQAPAPYVCMTPRRRPDTIWLPLL